MIFVPAVAPPSDRTGPEWWFFFKHNRLCVVTQVGTVSVPRLPAEAVPPEVREAGHCLGTLDGTPCFTAALPEDSPAPVGGEFVKLRGLYDMLPDVMIATAGRAFQVLEWDRTHRFCGACGKPLVTLPTERGRRCEPCDLVFYPRITPAIITAVVKDGSILLAHNRKFQQGLYSLIAGFVEAGESLEECVQREVNEETGLTVGRITYFGSQPWPFPNSLMIGFFAEWAEGEIRPDGEEITHAAWFNPETLPLLPAPGSISRKIIDRYVEEHAASCRDSSR
jgi:NAD+ diphosphatase